MNNIKIKILAGIAVISLLLVGCERADTKEAVTETINVKIPTDPVETKPVVPPTEPITPDPIEPEYKSAGWYGKTEVSATAADGTVYTHKSAGVFGVLLQSDDGKDRHDIAGYGASLFQVIFLPEFSTDTTAGYFSEYKANDDNTSRKVWTFQLKNQNTVDLSNAPVSIHLNGIYDVEYKEENTSVTYRESSTVNDALKNKLTLVDVDNQTSYTVDELATANLKMDGKHTRTFRWVFGAVDATDYDPIAAPQRSAGRNPEPEFKITSQPTDGSKFGLPPL